MSVVRAGAAVSVAAAALIALATPWKSPPSAPALGAFVSRIDEPASIEAIGREAIELVPAIRPPTSADGLVRSVAYLRLPPGATLRGQLRDGVATLEVPPGTIASRVEAIADGDD